MLTEPRILNNTYNTEQTSTENYVQVLGKLVLNSELTDTEQIGTEHYLKVHLHEIFYFCFFFIKSTNLVP
jgi:hypothetical protein